MSKSNETKFPKRGERVYHDHYGYGIIKKYDRDREVVVVNFKKVEDIYFDYPVGFESWLWWPAP